MTINAMFNNSRNDYFKARVNAANLGNGNINTAQQALLYAVRYHEPTRTEWTAEEWAAHEAKFGAFISSASDASAEANQLKTAYMEDLLNFRHQQVMRSFYDTATNQSFGFNEVTADFIHNQRSHGDSFEQPDFARTFQMLANKLYAGKARIHAHHEAQGGRWSSEEMLETGLHNLMTQFNETVDFLAGWFAMGTEHTATFHSGNIETVAHSIDSILRLGEFVKGHIWSGGSAENMTETLTENGFGDTLSALHTVADENLAFNRLMTDGQRRASVIPHHEAGSTVPQRIWDVLNHRLNPPNQPEKNYHDLVQQMMEEATNASQNAMLQLLQGATAE